MSFKLSLLLAFLWAAPTFGMGRDLTVTEVVTHPPFIEIKAAFEEIGGIIQFIKHDTWRCIRVKLGAKPNQFSTIPCDDLFLGRLEKSVRYYRELWWRINLPKSLQGLCVLRLAEEYKKDNQEVIAGFAILPEDLKKQILLMAGEIRGAE